MGMSGAGDEQNCDIVETAVVSLFVLTVGFFFRMFQHFQNLSPLFVTGFCETYCCKIVHNIIFMIYDVCYCDASNHCNVINLNVAKGAGVW